MLKQKGLFGCLLLASSTISWASCGSYIGLSVGPQYANFKQRAYVVNPNVNVIDKNRFAGKGGFVSLFAGYGLQFATCDMDCDDYYVAAELNVDAGTIKYKLTNEERVSGNLSHSIYKLRRDYGFSVIPGYFLSDCSLFYIRLGVANGKFSIDTTDATIGNLKKNLSGFRYGIGLRQSLSECFAVRMDYSQATYRNAVTNTYDPFGLTSKTTFIKPYTQKLELAVIYTF